MFGFVCIATDAFWFVCMASMSLINALFAFWFICITTHYDLKYSYTVSETTPIIGMCSVERTMEDQNLTSTNQGTGNNKSELNAAGIYICLMC